MKRVKMQPLAVEALQALASSHGVTAEVYLDALLNYAWSQHRRPGSWEACAVFDFAAYDQRDTGDASLRGCADRWWPAPECARRVRP
jgi:hypothetical protein